MPISREELRLSPEDLDSMLREEKVLRAGTASPKGSPHVAPLWFVWHDGQLWINSLRRSRRGADLQRGSRVALCIDAGTAYQELRGAVFYGRLVDATDDPRVSAVHAEFCRKYWNGLDIPQMRSHVWLRLEQTRMVSWDFRKIPSGADKRLEKLKAEET